MSEQSEAITEVIQQWARKHKDQKLTPEMVVELAEQASSVANIDFAAMTNGTVFQISYKAGAVTDYSVPARFMKHATVRDYSQDREYVYNFMDGDGGQWETHEMYDAKTFDHSTFKILVAGD